MNSPAKPSEREQVSSTADKPLPHDRDEKAQPPVENAQHRHNRKPIDQAHRDVEGGIRDTERIGTPNDVPASGEAGGSTKTER